MRQFCIYKGIKGFVRLYNYGYKHTRMIIYQSFLTCLQAMGVLLIFQEVLLCDDRSDKSLFQFLSRSAGNIPAGFWRSIYKFHFRHNFSRCSYKSDFSLSDFLDLIFRHLYFSPGVLDFFLVCFTRVNTHERDPYAVSSASGAFSFRCSKKERTSFK